MSRMATSAKQKEERKLYPGVKNGLMAYLRQADEDFTLLLEITADRMPERMKAFLQSNLLFLVNTKELRPDLFGHMGPDCTQVYGRDTFLLTAEVKSGVPSVNDIFQAKKYGELYNAPVALLASTEPPEERVLRLLEERPDLLGYAGTYSVYLCGYDEQDQTISWWFEDREPRRK
jgi:hypothetical protein